MSEPAGTAAEAEAEAGQEGDCGVDRARGARSTTLAPTSNRDNMRPRRRLAMAQHSILAVPPTNTGFPMNLHSVDTGKLPGHW